jgi:hypothetical protein
MPTYLCLRKPLESYLVRRVTRRTGSSCEFALTLSYMDSHAIAQRSHRWCVEDGSDTKSREAVELAHFRADTEQWLERESMRLVDGDPVPLLAPIEDGA